jgi:multidrug transporter EmrE-like cation transporter
MQSFSRDSRLTSSSTVFDPTVVDERAEARRSFLLVFSCTLIGALAQILVKQGTTQLGGPHITLGQAFGHPNLVARFCLAVITNLKLFIGYGMYGINTFLMALALKGRELSRIYPIIALTYVWVTILSLFVLPGEHLNLFQTAGIAFIVAGVSVLGMKK